MVADWAAVGERRDDWKDSLVLGCTCTRTESEGLAIGMETLVVD